MHRVDVLGRKRQPGQGRGLRSLYPKLPGGHRSRLIRVAMSEEAWRRIESHATGSSASTAPRALGEVIEQLLGKDEVADRARGAWQDWQMRKEMALLRVTTAG